MHGITAEEWDALYEHQSRGCAICGIERSGQRRLHVDHDHDSDAGGGFGLVRGLLCAGCNSLLGAFERFQREPVLAEAMLRYIEVPPARQLGIRARSMRRRDRVPGDLVRQIRDRYAAGDVTQLALAEEFGLSQGYVGMIVNRTARATR
jgi:hypothetical protein